MFTSLFSRVLLGAGLLFTCLVEPTTQLLASSPTAHKPTARTTGSFTGVLLDQSTGRPLSNATIILMRRDTKQLVAGAVTAENGEFRLDRATLGRYVLHVEVPGYEPRQGNYTLSPKRRLIDLGTYALTPRSTGKATPAGPMGGQR